MPTTPRDPRFDRLPKWAQDQINRLERQVAELEAAVAERDAPMAGSNTVVIGFGEGHRPLRDGAAIGFGDFTGNPNALPRFQARLVRKGGNGGVGEPGDLEIHGIDGLIIVPQVTNVVCLRLARKPR